MLKGNLFFWNVIFIFAIKFQLYNYDKKKSK